MAFPSISPVLHFPHKPHAVFSGPPRLEKYKKDCELLRAWHLLSGSFISALGTWCGSCTVLSSFILLTKGTSLENILQVQVLFQALMRCLGGTKSYRSGKGSSVRPPGSIFVVLTEKRDPWYLVDSSRAEIAGHFIGTRLLPQSARFSLWPIIILVFS